MIYFAATKDTEAYIRLNSYHTRSLDNAKKATEYVRKLCQTHKDIRFYQSDGYIRSIVGCEPIDEIHTINPKGSSGWFFRRIKPNMPHIKYIEGLRLACPDGWAEACFGESKMTFLSGLRIANGVTGGYAGYRLVIGFHDQTHLDDYKDLDWPKGLRRVKESTVVKWQEND